MLKIPIAEIKEKIIKSKKLTAEKLEEKIQSKIQELSGLISEEGAAHIIANELGVELVKQNSQLKIKEIYQGMRGIKTVGRIVKKFDVREFAKGDSTGKVCSIIMGDETGTIRVVFWNEQVDLIDKVQPNDIIAIDDAYVRENRGGNEIHLGQKGHIIVNPEGETVAEVQASPRTTITELQPGQNAEVTGTVVQVFDPRFFNVCPECSRRAADGNCATHGAVTPALSYVLNLVVDDGTGTIRCVFWKEQTNKLTGKETLEEYKDNSMTFEEVKTDLLGEQFKLQGQVKKNDMFDRLEFSVQSVDKASAEEELKRLE